MIDIIKSVLLFLALYGTFASCFAALDEVINNREETNSIYGAVITCLIWGVFYYLTI